MNISSFFALFLAFLISVVLSTPTYARFEQEIRDILSEPTRLHSGDSALAALNERFTGEEIDQILRSEASKMFPTLQYHLRVIGEGAEMEMTKRGMEVSVELYFRNTSSAEKKIILSRSFHFPAPVAAHQRQLQVRQRRVMQGPLNRRDLLDIVMKLQMAAIISSIVGVFHFLYLNDYDKALYFFLLTNVAGLIANLLRLYYL